VGRGLCSAVAIGNVFSSPSSAQIHAASRAVASDAGLLYLYGNYVATSTTSTSPPISAVRTASP
jgi:dihydroxyacetone kinase